VPPSQASEYSYPHILNRVLPPEIRVLAWSPLPQEVPSQNADSSDTAHSETAFDARFSCTTRHYRYFFSRHPVPDHPPLDIPRMQAAAARLIGEHDFRNFCKVDGSKQIENHCRRVLKAVVRPDDARSLDQIEQADLREELPQSSYVFELVGSAFLWHQVRHIMSVLFHVGHGFEDPEVVTRLLNTGYKAVGDADCDIPAGVSLENGTVPVASKPLYVMGAALPLQLYRCGYDSGAIDWRYGGFDGPVGGEGVDEQTQNMAREGHMSVLTSLNSQAEEARIKARQIQAFYQEAIQINRPSGLFGESSSIDDVAATSFTLGGGEVQAGRKYVKFLDRPRGDPVEEQNRRWREGKGENRRLRKLAESEDRK
jgi:tRNA pseudouridine38/39 synthase